MKMKMVFGLGLGAVMLLSLVGFASANAEQSKMREVPPPEAIAQDVLSRESENGVQFRVGDGEWVSQSDYEQSLPKTEWWTAAEYESWLSEQRAELEALIGTGNGWYDGQGVYHKWTQEIVDAEIAKYEEILEEIKAGVLYAKPDEDGDSFAQIPPSNDDLTQSYSADILKSDGSTFHIGDYETENELNEAINNAVENGKITQEEANSVLNQ